MPKPEIVISRGYLHVIHPLIEVEANYDLDRDTWRVREWHGYSPEDHGELADEDLDDGNIVPQWKKLLKGTANEYALCQELIRAARDTAT